MIFNFPDSVFYEQTKKYPIKSIKIEIFEVSVFI